MQLSGLAEAGRLRLQRLFSLHRDSRLSMNWMSLGPMFTAPVVMSCNGWRLSSSTLPTRAWSDMLLMRAWSSSRSVALQVHTMLAPCQVEGDAGDLQVSPRLAAICSSIACVVVSWCRGNNVDSARTSLWAGLAQLVRLLPLLQSDKLFVRSTNRCRWMTTVVVLSL